MKQKAFKPAMKILIFEALILVILFIIMPFIFGRDFYIDIAFYGVLISTFLLTAIFTILFSYKFKYYFFGAPVKLVLIIIYYLADGIFKNNTHILGNYYIGVPIMSSILEPNYNKELIIWDAILFSIFLLIIECICTIGVLLIKPVFIKIYKFLIKSSK